MKVLIAGDYSPVGRCETLLNKKSYDDIFGEIKPLSESHDYSIVNFETTVAEKGVHSIRKTGPALKCSAEAVEAIKWSGFDCVTLANNHFRDYGDESVAESIEVINNNGLDYVGGGRDIKEASKILYKRIGNQVLAIINACEHEYSIATANNAGSNPLNPIRQYYSIRDAKQKSDFVVVIVHGGSELLNLPTPRMQETYRFFIDAGADVVVNGHQHCYSGYEIYNGKPIFYGIGNFCFDKLDQDGKETAWNMGYLISLDLNANSEPLFELIPFVQFGEGVGVKVLNSRAGFDKEIERLNAIISSPEELRRQVETFYDAKSKALRFAIEPYKGRILYSLYVRNLLPQIAALGNKKLEHLNVLQCESHRDMLFYIFKKELEK